MAIRRITDLSAVHFNEDYFKDTRKYADLMYSALEMSWNLNGEEHSKFQSVQTTVADLSSFITYDLLKGNAIIDGDKLFTGDIQLSNGLNLSGNFYLNYPGPVNNYVMSVNVNTFTAYAKSNLNLLTNSLCADTNTLKLIASNSLIGNAQTLDLNATSNANINANTITLNANNNIVLSPKKNISIQLDSNATNSNFSVERNGEKIMNTYVNNNGENCVQFAHTIQGTALQALWADLAELYESDQQYLPGTLVKFGGSKEITIATDEVNAVITTNPGFVLNSTKENCQGIALVGRTPVRVFGKVNKFDNLYLSDIPGVASTKVNGKVIAKALNTKTTEDIDLLECVVKLEF